MKHAARFAAVSLSALLALSTAQGAQVSAPPIQTQQSIAYISGGIGEEERTAMQAVRAQYTLCMTFANRGSGEYRADVEVNIEDAKGQSVFSTSGAGPLLYARLAPGHYQVTATRGGKALRQATVVVAGQARELVFYWPAD